jgi:hypothetical protein
MSEQVAFILLPFLIELTKIFESLLVPSRKDTGPPFVNDLQGTKQKAGKVRRG